MKVYVLTWTRETDTDILGVYDSEEKAKKEFFYIIEEEFDGVENGFLDEGDGHYSFRDAEEVYCSEQELKVTPKEVE